MTGEPREVTLRQVKTVVHAAQGPDVSWPYEALVAECPNWARLGWNAAEIAEILRVDLARVRSALREARKAVKSNGEARPKA